MNQPFVRWWVPVYLYAGLIFTVSSLPSPLPAFKIPFLDKGLHAVEYGVLGFLLARAISNDSPRKLQQDFRLWAALFAFLYGLGDEWHQSFVPMREASLLDALFDGLGAFVGQFFFQKGSSVWH